MSSSALAPMWTPPYTRNAELTQSLLRETNSPFGEAKSSVLAVEWGEQERRGERGQEGTGGTLSSGAGIATSRTSYLFHEQNTTFLHPLLRHLSHWYRQAKTQLYTILLHLILTPMFLCILFNTASYDAHQIPVCRRMLGLNQRLLQCLH
jgi:hypothetical protein